MYVCTWHTDGSASGTVAPVPTHTSSPAPAPLSAVTVCCQGCAGIRIRVRMCGCQLGYALRRVACLGVDNDALAAHQTSWFCLISLPFQHSSPMDCSLCGCRTHFVHIPFFVFNLNFCSARCSFGSLGLFSSLISHFFQAHNLMSHPVLHDEQRRIVHTDFWVKSVKKFIVSLRIRHVVRGMFKQTKNVDCKMENVNGRRNYFSYAFPIYHLRLYSLAIRENLYCCINIAKGMRGPQMYAMFSFIRQFDMVNFLNRFFFLTYEWNQEQTPMKMLRNIIQKGK